MDSYHHANAAGDSNDCGRPLFAVLLSKGSSQSCEAVHVLSYLQSKRVATQINTEEATSMCSTVPVRWVQQNCIYLAFLLHIRFEVPVHQASRDAARQLLSLQLTRILSPHLYYTGLSGLSHFTCTAYGCYNSLAPLYCKHSLGLHVYVCFELSPNQNSCYRKHHPNPTRMFATLPVTGQHRDLNLFDA